MSKKKRGAYNGVLTTLRKKRDRTPGRLISRIVYGRETVAAASSPCGVGLPTSRGGKEFTAPALPNGRREARGAQIDLPRRVESPEKGDAARRERRR